MSGLSHYILLIIVMVLPATSISAQERPRIMPAPPPNIPATHADLVYRDTGKLKLLADAYLPDSEEPTAAIAWFPGGAFRIRNKLMIRGSILDQVERGIAVICFEYSLADESKWPAQAHDGKAAIRWLRARTGEFNIDPERIFIGGGSAGAIIANIVANSAGDESLEEAAADNADMSDHVSGIIAFYGAADLTTHGGWPADDSVAASLTGCASEDCRSIVESASPLHHVSANSPPALLFHGMGDVVIDYRQSILLQEKLNEVGVDAQLVLRTDLIHGDSRFDEPAMTDLITRFVSDRR